MSEHDLVRQVGRDGDDQPEQRQAEQGADRAGCLGREPAAEAERDQVRRMREQEFEVRPQSGHSRCVRWAAAGRRHR